MNSRSLLSLADLPDCEIRKLCDLCASSFREPSRRMDALKNRRVGLLFNGTSTRTRSSFWRAAVDCGAQVLSYSSHDLQTNTGETLEDTGKVLAEYIDVLVIRTNGPLTDMRAIARGPLSTINAMSACEHPTQALADYCAILEHFGAVDGIRLAYAGDGNNTAVALALLFSNVPNARIDFFLPAPFSLPPEILDFAMARAKRNSASIAIHHAIPRAPPKVDVVYTTRWQTMGVQRSGADWRGAFEHFKVTGDLFERLSLPGHTVFMHDLPAVRGEEVDANVLDGSSSIAWRQAHHKLSAAMGSYLYTMVPNS